MQTVFIGINGRSGHGKDAAAKAIIEARHEEYDIRRYSFGDFVRAEVAGNELEICLRHGLPYEPEQKHRSLLQWWGSEYRRAQDPYYWIKMAARKIASEKPQVALITDLRFMNEFVWMVSKGGFTLKVERIGHVNLNPQQAAHISEHELDRVLFDYHIQVADGDEEELKLDAVRVFDMITESLRPPELADLHPKVVVDG